jgi:predicted acetylornithine/succinylornithine family transaminase
MSSLFANYKRASVAFERGAGMKLYDTEGKEYLDFLAGIAVSSLGHSHPRMVAALTAQVGKLVHVSNLYTIPEQEEAASRLTSLCGFDKAFFCNSGAEANEALIKMARRHAHQQGHPPSIVVAHNSFHGRTMATLSATGNPRYQENFHPLVEGFRFVDFNSSEQALEALESACAILLEPVQGEGGVVPAAPGYLQAVQRACRQSGKLFFLDEVQTGIGRSGEWLAAQHYGVEPDAVALAKGLGAGVPVGAVLASDKLAALLPPGAHGTTFGGNLLASRAALTVLETIEEEGLLERVKSSGAYLRDQLATLSGAREVRGLGLLLAVELESLAAPVVEACMEKGLLLNAVRPHAIRLAPPLILERDDIDRAIEILEEAICQTTSVAAASAPSSN